MIDNPQLSRLYGSANLSLPRIILPQPFKPSPDKGDYASAYISRTIVLKRNDVGDGREIDPSLIGLVNEGSYQIYSIRWKISGSRNKKVVDGIVEDFGVEDSNKITIQKAHPAISRILSDPLEFWRGY